MAFLGRWKEERCHPNNVFPSVANPWYPKILLRSNLWVFHQQPVSFPGGKKKKEEISRSDFANTQKRWKHTKIWCQMLLGAARAVILLFSGRFMVKYPLTNFLTLKNTWHFPELNGRSRKRGKCGCRGEQSSNPNTREQNQVPSAGATRPTWKSK